MTYRIARDGQVYGPYSLLELQRYLASGQVIATDLAQSATMNEWLPVATLFPTSPMLEARPYPGGLPKLFPDPPNLPWWLALIFGIVTLGAFFSNLVMYFIILTTALTLHRHGLIHIDTSKQAAQALGPLAGPFSALLYTVGLLGVGFLAIPTLSGSAAYALAETFRWREGLDNPLRRAPQFYIVIILSMLIGVSLNFLRVNPVRALYWSAVLNGLLAPFLLVAILLIASNRKLMQGQPSSRLGWIVVAVTAATMFICSVAMFVV